MTGYQADRCANCQHVEGDHVPGGGWLDPSRGRCRAPGCSCKEYEPATASERQAA